MPIIEWNVSHLLGIHEIDEHHKHIVKTLNRIYDEFREGISTDQAVIDGLIEYTANHFACEERLMVEMSYPKLAEHKGEHEMFASRVSEILKSKKSASGGSVELLWFLCNWVTHHLRETDAEFGRFVDVWHVRAAMDKESS